MTIRRPDLPPITRRLNAELLGEQQFAGVDIDTAAAISAMNSRLLNVVAELENDLIISRARSSRSAMARAAS